MTHSNERSILTGLVAIQLQFIDQQQFVAAMTEWVEDKSKPLADVLRRRGDADDEALALIASVVENHIKRHGGNAQASIAALELSDSTDRSLQSIQDPVVAAARSRIPSTHHRSMGAVSQIRPEDSDEADKATNIGDVRGPDARGRFSILHPLNRGGLGEVFVAEDHELNRRVALKEIQEKHADLQESRARFLLEGELTGQLEHPNIVPVYGLGTTDDGRPFYAMRLVKGKNLSETIRSFFATRPSPTGADYYGSDFRRLLGRFIDVCEAMEFAHARGVLHRDLKPGNIMLGRHGETLVVDWGLAKATGISGGSEDKAADPNQETLLKPRSGDAVSDPPEGSAIGTPHYMSPEAARGELSKLSPATDVYSLGATLYHMLTNHTPFDAGPDLLERVRTSEFPTPRERVPAVPKPLEAICLKAMSSGTGTRFENCRELARDIERLLADEPVTAFSDPLTARVSRFARKNWTAVATGAVTCAIALVCISILLIALKVNNHRLYLLSRTEAAQRQAAEQQSRFAFTSLREARNSQDAYGMIAYEFTALSEELFAEYSGNDSSQAKLLADALRLHDTRELRDIPKHSILRRAAIHRRLAAIYRIQNKLSIAESHLTQAKLLLDSQFGADGDVAFHRAALLRESGVLRKTECRMGDALEDLHTAESILVKLSESNLNDSSVLRSLQNVNAELGAAYLLVRRHDVSLNYSMSAWGYFSEQASEKTPLVSDYAYALIAATNAETCLTKLERNAEAERMFSNANSLGDRAVKDVPSRTIRTLTAVHRLNHVELLLDRDRSVEEEEGMSRLAVAELAQLANRYGGRAETNYQNARRILAKLLIRLAQLPEAA